MHRGARGLEQRAELYRPLSQAAVFKASDSISD